MEKIFEINNETSFQEGAEMEKLQAEKHELEEKYKVLEQEFHLITEQKAVIDNMHDNIKKDYFDIGLELKILQHRIKLLKPPTSKSSHEYSRDYISMKKEQLESDSHCRTGLDKVNKAKEELANLTAEDEIDREYYENNLKEAIERHKKLLLEKKETEKNLDQWRKQNEASLSE